MRAIRIAATLGAATLALAGCANATEALTNGEAFDVTRTAAQPAGEALAAELLFIVEEEKLAHDVYVALNDVWDARVFANISRAETQHAASVAMLLDAYGLDDPRSDQEGVFTDPTLQALYDDLVASGSESWEAAVQAGITVEETDIADLTEALAAAPDDVRVVLERLLAGSQRHLEAFKRQALAAT
jgi:hypothetical protein